MAKPSTVFRNWRIWLKDQFIANVPPEGEFCEFECKKTQCQFGHWATCERRLAHLNLGKAPLTERRTTPSPDRLVLLNN
jgi:hypothetical protein